MPGRIAYISSLVAAIACIAVLGLFGCSSESTRGTGTDGDSDAPAEQSEGADTDPDTDPDSDSDEDNRDAEEDGYEYEWPDLDMGEGFLSDLPCTTDSQCPEGWWCMVPGPAAGQEETETPLGHCARKCTPGEDCPEGLCGTSCPPGMDCACGDRQVCFRGDWEEYSLCRDTCDSDTKDCYRRYGDNPDAADMYMCMETSFTDENPTAVCVPWTGDSCCPEGWFQGGGWDYIKGSGHCFPDPLQTGDCAESCMAGYSCRNGVCHVMCDHLGYLCSAQTAPRGFGECSYSCEPGYGPTYCCHGMRCCVTNYLSTGEPFLGECREETDCESGEFLDPAPPGTIPQAACPWRLPLDQRPEGV